MTPEETIVQLRAELAALRQEQQTFAATVTHDLRAPLRHIDAYAKLLREEAGSVLNEEALGFIDTITRSAHTLSTQLDALSRYAQLATVALQLQQVELEALVPECVQEINAAVASAGGPHVHWEIAIPVAAVWADAALLKQALLHVMGNAVFFSQKCAAPMVSISLVSDAPAGTVDLEVRDNGMGCDLTHSDRLFSVFARMHSPRQLQGLTPRTAPLPGLAAGLGMGLASTRRILQRLGGEVTLQSAPEAGCTARLQLRSAP